MPMGDSLDLSSHRNVVFRSAKERPFAERKATIRHPRRKSVVCDWRHCVHFSHEYHSAAESRDGAGILDQRRHLQRAVFPGRPHDGYLLPPDLPGPEAVAEECGVFPGGARGHGRRLSAVQALQALGGGRSTGVGGGAAGGSRAAAGGADHGGRFARPGHRAGDGAAAFPPAVWHDVSGVRPGAAAGGSVHANPRRRGR